MSSGLPILACLLITAMSGGGAWASGGIALQADGSTRPVDESTMQGLRDSSWPGWIALRVDAADDHPPEAQSMAGFDDGQRLVGEFDGTTRELRWRHRELGVATLDLERLSWVGPPALAVTAPPTRDRLVLMNGDRIEGFIVSIRTDRGVEMELPPVKPGETPERTWYDLSKGLACIQLVPRGHPASGWRFWLRDGSVVDADSWQRVGERLILTGCHLPGAPPSISVAWASVRAVARAEGGVQALASRPWVSHDIPDTPRLSPATLGAAELPGPLEIRALDLRGPGIFWADIGRGCGVQLKLEPPSELSRVVDCTVTLLDGDRVVVSTTLRPDTGPIQVRDTIQSGRLTVKVDPGSRGAFGSAVRISDGLVLEPVKAPESATPPASSAPAKPASPATSGIEEPRHDR